MALLALSACTGTDESTLIVDLRTDLVPGVDFGVARLSLDGTEVTARAVSASEIGGLAYQRGVRLARLPLDTGRDIRLRADLSRLGTVVVEGRYVLRTEPGSLGIVLRLDRSCRGVPCDDESTCARGACAPQTCISGSEPACEEVPRQCRADTECEAPQSSCARPRCEEGACIYERSACEEGDYCDLEEGCVPLPTAQVDAGVRDAGPGDAGPPDAADDANAADATASDASAPDASVPVPSGVCDPETGESVFLFAFDEADPLRDATGQHRLLAPTASAYELVPGRSGCGSAIRFMDVGAPYFLGVADSTDFDLEEASIELWLRHDGTELTRGVLSRDRLSADPPGRLNIELSRDHEFFVRHQFREISPGLNEDRDLLSAPLPVDTWVHLGIYVSPAINRLYVDGIEVAASSEIDAPEFRGLIGNRQPWVLGSSAKTSSAEEFPGSLYQPAVGVTLDHVRLSPGQLDFAALAGR